MFDIKDLSYCLGNRFLYEKVSLHIEKKDKLGLVGLNGTGKSTLLRIINGEKKPESGSISISKGESIGFLNQDLMSYQSDDSIKKVAMNAFAELLKIDEKINFLLKKLESDYSDKDIEELTKLQDDFANKGGYEIEPKTEAVLLGIGFSINDLNKPLSSFSGGWRMRVMLAKLLLENPSLLMLDEPTNHLDIDSIGWFENYIKFYEGAIIIVSHDRSFLDNTTNKIVEIFNKSFHFYSGNYSFYEKEKVVRSELQDRAYENQQQQIKKTQEFINRFGAKASKASQVQSRVKSLEKMEKIEKSSKSSANVKFNFQLNQKSGKVVAEITEINKSYPGIKLLQNASVQINREDKIALIGANGKGKTTLLNIISKAFEKDQSDCKIEIGHNVNYSFFAQHQLESLNLNNNIIEELQSCAGKKEESEIRKIAGMFLFTKDDVYKKISVLSGGERTRVALAKVLLNDSNFLILDEPTNHLDMISVEGLAKSLVDYQGTFIVVSHDRHFLSKIANKIWYIENYKVEEFTGSYLDYTYYMKNIKNK
jgi:ATP-binding cassette subfamily F protein 3